MADEALMMSDQHDTAMLPRIESRIQVMRVSIVLEKISSDVTHYQENQKILSNAKGGRNVDKNSDQWRSNVQVSNNA